MSDGQKPRADWQVRGRIDDKLKTITTVLRHGKLMVWRGILCLSLSNQLHPPGRDQGTAHEQEDGTDNTAEPGEALRTRARDVNIHAK